MQVVKSAKTDSIVGRVLLKKNSDFYWSWIGMQKSLIRIEEQICNVRML